MMRARRLLSILLLLQTYPQLSAAQLAARFEVSVRTIQRDIEALSSAGIPLVPERGRAGGWSLLEGYRSNLVGLNNTEIQTLVLNPNRVLKDLGMEEAAEAASMKILASLPAFRRHEAKLLRECIYVDSAPWQSQDEDLGRLPLLQEAIWQNRRALICYQKAEGEPIERWVEPLGLVAKGRIWYCVAKVEEDFRTYRVSRILEIRLAEHFARPKDFDLAAYWQASSQEFTANLPHYPARLRIHLSAIRFLQAWRWARIVSIEEEGDWRIVTVHFEEIEEASAAVLACGALARVLEPADLAQRVDEKIRDWGIGDRE